MIKEKEVKIPLNTRIANRLATLGYVLPTHIRRGFLQFDIGATITIKVEHLSKTSPVKVTRICDKCGIEWRAAYSKHKNVCVKCSAYKIGLALKGKNNGMFGKKGELHPRWNPAKTNNDRLEGKNRIQTKEHQRWSKTVMKLYDFTCQYCDTVGQDLESHHIESWNSNKKLRLEISNGICFCKPCHREFHRIYGKGNNTKLQLIEFLGEINKCLK